MLLVKAIIGCFFQLGLFWCVVILPAGLIAGDWAWTRGWQFLSIYAGFLAVALIIMARIAPASLAARTRGMSSDDQEPDDKRATNVLVAALILSLATPSIDLHSVMLFGGVGVALQTAGAVLWMCGFVFLCWVIVANEFAIPVVEDQSDKQQTLIDTGPYAIVRHPMYGGLIVFVAGISLYLGSLLGLAGVCVFGAALVPRIRVEERTLLATLDGYEDFTKRRRWRVIPGIH